MASEYHLMLILYILLGAVAAMIYGLKKIFTLDRRILRMEQNILLMHRKMGIKTPAPAVKKAKLKKKKK